MDRITQEAYYRQRVLKYEAKHRVTRAAERYGMSRKTVHKWKGRYDGTVESLKNRSRAPLRSPKKQSEWEIRLAERHAKKYPRGLPPGYEKAQKNGHVRSYGCFKRTRPQSSSRPRTGSAPGRASRMNARRIPARSSGWRKNPSRPIAWPTAGNTTNSPPRTSARAGRTGKCTRSTARTAPGNFC